MSRGLVKTYGLYYGKEQIGFQCFAEYTPWADKNKKRILHFNRTVIHPDYAGFGLRMKLIDETSALLSREYKIMGKFSSLPVYKAMSKNPKWKLRNIVFFTPSGTGNMIRSTGFRNKIKQWSFEYIGN